MHDQSQQTSIPLIYLNNDPDPKFILNPKALQIIQSYSSKDNNNVSFISICGDYRSGKSFLMNSLFFSKEGFKVSPTTQPCTKGINMWSKPISANGKNMWILDTEGFGATDRDESHDVKIFLLTTLMSSIMMYNSFGALDENTINKLAGICFKAQQMDPTLGRIKMFWVLRDFSLKMENKEGRQLTADEYLSKALDDSTSNKEERTAIKKVFTQRHCIPLVRPVIDETALAQLNEIKFQQLRGQFVEEIYKLRKRMLAVVQGKVIQGMGLGVGNLGLVLGRYVEMLNNNEIETSVTATWEGIVKYQRQKFTSRIMDKTRSLVNSKLEAMPLTGEEMQGIYHQLNSLVENELSQFRNHFRDQSIVKQIQNEMMKYKNELMENLRMKNGQRIASDGKVALKSIFDTIERSMSKQFAGDAQAAMKYIEKMFKTKDEFFNKFAKFIQEPSSLISGQTGSGKSINNKNPQNLHPKPTTTNISSITKLMYYQQFYTQQKHLLPKVIGQFSQQMASTMIKLNQQKKLSKRYEAQLKQLKEENHLLNEDTRKLTQKVSSTQRSLTQLQKIHSIKQHEIQTITTRSQNEYLQLKAQYDESIQELKQTILSLEKNFMTLKKQTQLQKTQHNDKLKYLNQRHEMTINKLEQSQVMSQKVLQQVKEQYEEKLKRAQDKFQQMQTQLLTERKKFLELNKSKKEEESQLLEDLAEKNEKLLSLRREFVNVEHSYKEQLQIILKQQKSILSNEFTLQLQEKHHQLMVYQQKLQQCLVRIAELQQVDRKYQNLLMQHKLHQQQHEVLAVRYSEVVNKLKKSGELEKERELVIEAMKEKYQQEISSKEELLKKFKLQLKTSQEDHAVFVNKLEVKYQEQINNVKKQLQHKHDQRITSKVSLLETAHKEERNELHQELKQLFQEVQQLKLTKGKLTNEQMFIGELVRRLIGQYEIAQREVKGVMKKYNKLQLVGENNRVLQQANSSRLQSSQLDISLLTTTQPMIANTTIRQLCQHLESLITPLFQQWRSQSQNLQDLKHSFKQTITQLQQCQTHIHSLNAQISQHEVKIRGLQTQLQEYKENKYKLNEIEEKLYEVEKQNELLKNEVQVRDEIFSKREVSIKENLQLYKETIANLTQQNQHLSEKATKLQIQLNKFTDWQGDFLIPNNINNNYYNYNKPPSSMGSLQYLNQNQQADDNQYTLTQKLQQLQRQNRKLKKQLDHQQQLLMLQQSKHPSTLLSNILIDNNHKQIIEALKKQNIIYKQRVQQLRERQLKLIEQVKLVKQNERVATENRVNREREEFEMYRRKVKEEMMDMEKKVEELSEEKYKLRQEMLSVRQQHRQQKERGYVSSAKDLNRYSSYYNQSNKQNTQLTHQPTYLKPSSSDPTTQSLQHTITSLKHQNLKLHSQLTSLNQQLLKTKDQTDKKLAAVQVLYEQRIRQLESQKARMELQNEKNKTKYDHLLKVNNQLIVEVENSKARASGQMTLKEKYRSKITALFMEQ